jgi:ribosomal protein S18 acetylase RimI-like enzyme
MTPSPTSPEISALRHRDPFIAQAVVALQRRAYRVESELIGYPDLPPLKDTPTDIMTGTESFLGITSRGRLVALISSEHDGDTTIICRLCVAPESVRRGFASRLVRHVLKTAPGAVLVSTAQANIPATRLYRKLGFTTHRQWTTPDGLPLVSMRHPGIGRTDET